MKDAPSSNIDLAGMISRRREEIARLNKELESLELTQSLVAKEDAENNYVVERRERASGSEIAQYIASVMREQSLETIAPQDAVEAIGDAPFFDGLTYRTKHTYVSRAMKESSLFTSDDRGVYRLRDGAAE